MTAPLFPDRFAIGGFTTDMATSKMRVYTSAFAISIMKRP